MRQSSIICQLNFVIVKAVRQEPADLRAVKDIEVLVVFSRELLTDLLQMLRDALLDADLLCTTLSI